MRLNDFNCESCCRSKCCRNIERRYYVQSGDGRCIDIWRDPWVGDEQGRFIESEEVEGLRVVGDLIDVEKREWRTDLLDLHFSDRDRRCILAVPLNARGGSNEYMWAYSKDGSYTVKTAYMLGKGGNLDDYHGA